MGVLASTYDLKLPNVTVGGIAPRQQPLDRHAAQVPAKINIAIANYDGLVARTNRAEAAMWRTTVDGKIVNERAWYAAREKYDEALAQMKAAGVAAMAMCTEWGEALHAANPWLAAAMRDESGDEEAWDDTSPHGDDSQILLIAPVWRCSVQQAQQA